MGHIIQAVDSYCRKAAVHKVIDGDTIDLLIDLGWDVMIEERVRLLGVNAPEVRGEERRRGLEVKDKVVEWCESQSFVWIHSREYKKGKYGRTLGEIYSHDRQQCLNQLVEDWSEK